MAISKAAGVSMGETPLVQGMGDRSEVPPNWLEADCYIGIAGVSPSLSQSKEYFRGRIS